MKWAIVAVLTVVLFGAGAAYLSKPSPRSTFEYLVAKPIPQSVNSIQEGSFRAMDSVFRVLRFNISAAELRSILDSQGYKPLSQEEMGSRNRQDYLRHWEQRIKAVTKLEIHFAENAQGLTLKEGRGQKYMFWSTNTPEVVFVADAH